MSRESSDQHYGVMLCGPTGSGKSFVCDWLAPALHAVRLNPRKVANDLFGDDPEGFNFEKKNWVDKAVRSFWEHVLASNVSAVIDANMNMQFMRDNFSGWARAVGALPLMVYVDTPWDVAEERFLSSLPPGEAPDPNVFANHWRGTEPPQIGETAIVLRGIVSAEQQQIDFRRQFESLRIQGVI